MKSKKTKSLRQRTRFALRSRQLQYLEYIAERDEITLSRAVQNIIETAIEKIFVDPPMRTVKVRKHFMLPTRCVEYINLLASRWGIPRTDVGRRLIDDAAARDNTV